MTRRSGKRRPKRLAAAVVAGGLMLVPVTLATTGARYTIPISASLADGSVLPNPGDLLAAVRRAQAKPEDYGASGKLPEADTLSPELLAALAGPAAGDGSVFGTGAGPLASVPPGPLGIPGVLLDAYIRAERSLAASHPNCGVHWSVLAAIGRIESGHARGGAVDANGTTVRPILGPQLAGGPGMAAIPDSDGGALDGDRVWDRAVGPMQFIPTTWARYAADGNNDGITNPHNIYDSTVAAGRYLCAGGADLRNLVSLAQAIFRYNHSDAYVANVLNWAAAYAAGVTPLPPSQAPIGDQPPLAAPPPADPVPPGTTPPDESPPASSTTTTTTTTTSSTTTTSPTCPTEPPTTSTTTTTSETTTPPPAGCETTTPPPSSTTSEPPAQTSESQPESSTMQSSSVTQSSVEEPSSTTQSSAATPSSTTESATSSGGEAVTTTTSLPPT